MHCKRFLVRCTCYFCTLPLMTLLCVENTLLSSPNVARGIRRLTERQLCDGYQLVNKINSTRDKLLVGADQVT